MTKIANFGQARQVLDHYRPTDVGSSYTLTRMRALMDALDNPQDKVKVIHIAGTSGKTSTSYYVAALLVQAGKKVGLSVSPHIDEVNERLQVNIRPLDEKEFCAQLAIFIDIVKKTAVEPTYFELLVAFAYWYFAKNKFDYAVMEVGLGGLLDGTNVVTSLDKVAVITDIGLDHTHILGDNFSEITRQKAGIIQWHNVVFMYHQNKEVMNVVMEVCRRQHAQLHELKASDTLSIKSLAPFAQRNFSLANEVYKYLSERDNLPLLTKSQLDGAAHVTVPARMEVFNLRGKTLIVDGSHNGQKMQALAEGIKTLFPNRPAAAAISFVDHKQPYIEDALRHILPLTSSLILTSFKGGQDTYGQSIDPKLLSKISTKLGFNNYSVVADPKAAYGELLKRPEDLLVITGSFYLLNHIRPLILKK